VVEAALAAGADLDEIYLDLISPAMRNIGVRWADGELDISVEHRATGIAFRLIGRLGPRFARRGRTRGTIVVGAPKGERHSLPVAMLSDLLRGEGWEVSDLGADMPIASFVGSVLSTPGLVAVGVSVTSVECLPAAAELIAALLAASPTVPVVVGGAAVHDAEHALLLGATAWAPSAAVLASMLADGGASRAGTTIT
jgi:methanogenic corrinoid protein MtbC1